MRFAASGSLDVWFIAKQLPASFSFSMACSQQRVCAYITSLAQVVCSQLELSLLWKKRGKVIGLQPCGRKRVTSN